MPSLRLSAVLALAIVAVASSAVGQDEGNSFLHPKPKPKLEAPPKPKLRRPGVTTPGGAPETPDAGSAPAPENKAADAAAAAAAAQAAAEAAETQKLFQAQQAAKEAEDARERLAHAETVRHEIVGVNGLVDRLIAWQTKYRFSTQSGTAVTRDAYHCVSMDSSEWTPNDIIEATDERIPVKQLYFDLRRSHAGQTFGACMTQAGLSVDHLYAALHHAGMMELIVWFVPIPLIKDQRGWVPMTSANGTPTKTGLRIVLTEFDNTSLAWSDEVIIIPCPEMTPGLFGGPKCPWQRDLR
jgi:hypothetical protein